MKLVISLLLLSTSSAFVVQRNSNLKSFLSSSSVLPKKNLALNSATETETEVADGAADASAVVVPKKKEYTDEELQIFKEIDFKPDQIGLGVSPEEVRDWMGSRDYLIQKFVEDTSSAKEEKDRLTEDQAKWEVDKFMLDAEMVNRYIYYQKRKARGLLPDIKDDEELGEENKKKGLGDYINFTNVIYLYLGYRLAIFGISLFQNFSKGGSADVQETVDAAKDVIDAAVTTTVTQSAVDAM